MGLSKVQNVEVPKAMLRRLLRLARATAENLEADKHADQPRLVEVQLLRQVEAVESFAAKTLRVRS